MTMDIASMLNPSQPPEETSPPKHLTNHPYFMFLPDGLPLTDADLIQSTEELIDGLGDPYTLVRLMLDPRKLRATSFLDQLKERGIDFKMKDEWVTMTDEDGKKLDALLNIPITAFGKPARIAPLTDSRVVQIRSSRFLSTTGLCDHLSNLNNFDALAKDNGIYGGSESVTRIKKRDKCSFIYFYLNFLKELQTAIADSGVDSSTMCVEWLGSMHRAFTTPQSNGPVETLSVDQIFREKKEVLQDGKAWMSYVESPQTQFRNDSSMAMALIADKTAHSVLVRNTFRTKGGGPVIDDWKAQHLERFFHTSTGFLFKDRRDDIDQTAFMVDLRKHEQAVVRLNNKDGAQGEQIIRVREQTPRNFHHWILAGDARELNTVPANQFQNPFFSREIGEIVRRLQKITGKMYTYTDLKAAQNEKDKEREKREEEAEAAGLAVASGQGESPTVDKHQATGSPESASPGGGEGHSKDKGKKRAG